ncbi:MAG: hypothetical protein Q9168_005018 [Polycauliona sp. 1 TL-2023]
MEDIVGDYADKTVTLEDFPFFDAGVKMASVHPCRHASVMKTLLDRADAAMRLRLRKLRDGKTAEGGRGKVESGMEGLVEGLGSASLQDGGGKNAKGFKDGVAAAGGSGGDEWEVLQHESGGEREENEVAIRVDQYLVVFVKFLSTMTPSIEHDFTMGI